MSHEAGLKAEVPGLHRPTLPDGRAAAARVWLGIHPQRHDNGGLLMIGRVWRRLGVRDPMVPFIQVWSVPDPGRSQGAAISRPSHIPDRSMET